MENCLFCKIVRKEIPAYVIYENEHTLAFLDINPNENGHTLVIPKEHSVSFTKSDQKTILEVTKTKKIVSELLEKKLAPHGFNFVTNDGAVAFQEVFHYHEHVIPKYHKNEGYAPSKQAFTSLPLETIYDKIV